MWNSGKLGVSYYDVEEAQIHMMPDVTENDDFTMMKAGKIWTQIIYFLFIDWTEDYDRPNIFHLFIS